MNQRITKLMQKHGMAVYDVNFNGVVACINDMLEQSAVRLDERATVAKENGFIEAEEAYHLSAVSLRSMKESRS